jgi:hypothetical protein
MRLQRPYRNPPEIVPPHAPPETPPRNPDIEIERAPLRSPEIQPDREPSEAEPPPYPHIEPAEPPERGLRSSCSFAYRLPPRLTRRTGGNTSPLT